MQIFLLLFFSILRLLILLHFIQCLLPTSISESRKYDVGTFFSILVFLLSLWISRRTPKSHTKIVKVLSSYLHVVESTLKFRRLVMPQVIDGKVCPLLINQPLCNIPVRSFLHPFSWGSNSANIISMTMNVVCTTFLSVFQIKCPTQGYFFFGYFVLAMMIKKWGVISLQRMSLLRKYYYSLLDEWKKFFIWLRRPSGNFVA